MAEREIQDAKIVVRIDTEEAERQIADFERRRDGSASRRGDRDARDERRRGRERAGGDGTNVAVIPGTRILRRAVATFLQIELAKLGLAVGAGAIRDADIPQPIKTVTDGLANRMEAMSEAIQSVQSQIAAILGTTGDVVDLARSQKLLRGEVDTGALAEFADTRATVRGAEAALEARRRTIGRTAAGAIVADIAGQGVKAAAQATMDALQNAELGAQR